MELVESTTLCIRLSRSNCIALCEFYPKWHGSTYISCRLLEDK